MRSIKVFNIYQNIKIWLADDVSGEEHFLSFRKGSKQWFQTKGGCWPVPIQEIRRIFAVFTSENHSLIVGDMQAADFKPVISERPGVRRFHLTVTEQELRNLLSGLNADLLDFPHNIEHLQKCLDPDNKYSVEDLQYTRQEYFEKCHVLTKICPPEWRGDYE